MTPYLKSADESCLEQSLLLHPLRASSVKGGKEDVIGEFLAVLCVRGEWQHFRLITSSLTVWCSKGLRCEYAGKRKKRVKTFNSDHASFEIGLEISPERGQSTSRDNISQSSQSSLSAIYFLDIGAFRRARLQLQHVELECSKDVTDLVGTLSIIHTTAETYFSIVHLWMPIISKSRFYQQLLHPLCNRQTELSLLVLCMRLVSSSYTSSDDLTYQTAKRLFSETVSAGTLSINVLQAGILLALYEVGHAVYPAAFLSVGTCARYGIALDIDKAISCSIASHLPWNELEERRRVWWAILILDRSVYRQHNHTLVAAHKSPS
jgi:Fungal specific transcription factor domain